MVRHVDWDEDDDDEVTAVHHIIVADAGTPCLLVVSGSRAGQLTRIVRPGLSIGRSKVAEVCIQDDGVSRMHAQLFVSDRGAVSIEDLRSTNGTWVGGRRIVGRCPLVNGDHIRLGADVQLIVTMQDQAEETFLSGFYESATRDTLTKLHNRASFLIG